MASIEIVLNPNPINIDVVQLPQTNIDIVYTTGGAVSSVNGQTGNVLINAVPDGGTTGQVLAKASDDDNDTEWINQQSSHPFLSLLGNYKVDANNTTPPAANGRIKYSNAAQINSANLYVSAITDEGMDVEVLISLLNVGTILLIQDENDAANYQKWQISSTPTFQSISDSYTIPVTLLTSAGTGTSNFPNNHEVFFSAFLSAANPVWGGITGTLSSQTDLQSALDAKQNSLGYTAENEANKDTDGTLAANSDTKYPSQKAAKTYIDTGLSGKENALGFTPEDVSNKDVDGTLAANSDTKYPSQKAVKTYADTKRGLTPRVTSTTTATTLTVNSDTTDEAVLTALASNLTIANPTGTPSDGQRILIAIKDNGTARTITLGANIVDILKQVPSSTTANKWIYIELIYNTSAAAWQVIEVKGNVISLSDGASYFSVGPSTQFSGLTTIHFTATRSNSNWAIRENSDGSQLQLNSSGRLDLCLAGGPLMINFSTNTRFKNSIFIGDINMNTAPTAYLDLFQSTTVSASLRFRSGVAPTTPNNGDVWFDGTDLKIRVGGVTKTFQIV